MTTLFPLGYIFQFQRVNSQFKDKQKNSFDCHHGAHSLPPIPDNTDVWINDEDGKQVIM